MSAAAAPASTVAVRPPAALAVVGLGNMGQPMAMRLKQAGFAVSGYDLSDAARTRFAAAGGTAASDIGAAVASAAAVITLLPDGKSVQAALEAIRPHLQAGAVLIDMGSSDPLGTRELGGALIAAGFGFVDAPVSGGVRRAVSGTLSIMAGGEPTTIERIEPVLSAMGSSIFRTGALGSGHALKALNNYVSAAGLTAAVEALAIGKAFGLDPALVTDVLNASTGRNNSTELKLKQYVISESFASGFSLKLMAKDLRTADGLAAALGVAAPLADYCADLWNEAEAGLGERADHTEIGRHIAKKT